MIHIGTAGWTIPLHHQPNFPPEGAHLERYGVRMSVAEINSSFHRHHRRTTYLRWAQSVPDTFRFSAKVPRSFTHEGALHADPETLARFADEVSALEHKLGALLVQLPPKLAFEAKAAEQFFREVRSQIDVPYVCEPRHASWGSHEADSLLTSLNVARAAADPAPFPTAGEPGGSSKLVYFRWHGQPRKYYSEYDETSLTLLRNQVAAAASRGATVWVIFDNTVLGHALGNAITLRRLLDEQP